jgi:hypothetical protein
MGFSRLYLQRRIAPLTNFVSNVASIVSTSTGSSGQEPKADPIDALDGELLSQFLRRR